MSERGQTVLICTVGGSDQPIVKAIGSARPDHVIFVCTDIDPVTGREGSRGQIEGEGKVCGATRDQRAARPAIPIQTELRNEQWEILIVPPDDPSATFSLLHERMATETAQDNRVTLDYTGGTKSMSAGALTAAFHTPAVATQIVTGPRSDLVAVRDGLERVRPVSDAVVRDVMRLENAAAAWAHHGYAEAEHLLQDADSAEAQRVWLLSKGYAAWDSFDHAAALGFLRDVARFVGNQRMAALAVLAGQTSRRDSPQHTEAYRIVDLLHTAERRARQRQFDGAALLTYRALEWIAQWTLRWNHGIDSVDVDLGEHPALEPFVSRNHLGNAVLGMHAAWLALAEVDDPLAEAARATEQQRRTFAELRNASIYAHGDVPVPREAYERFQRWFDTEIHEPFCRLAFQRKADPYPQLPTDWSEDR